MKFRILSAGPGVTLQDEGRRGFLRYGVTPAGPMDADAFLAATRAAGAEAAIEVSLGGVELAAVEGEIGLAICGGNFDVRLDGRPLPGASALTLAPGARLTLRAGASGAWAYVAPFGRFDLPKVLGSLSTHTRSGLGGLEGRALAAGDALNILDARAGPKGPVALRAPWLGAVAHPFRVLLGPQQNHFSNETLAKFLASSWRLSARSDRMAYRLDGPPLAHRLGHDIVSDGLAMGAIQIPGDGAPLVLMADRQPTGGYPKIAHVIRADLPALAQKRPGEEVRFAQVSLEEALEARRAGARALAEGVRLEAITPELTSELLLERNLVGGVIGDFTRLD
ncbi:MAG: biotin-dependent carboxyltransferase family protein [Methylocystis sp.]